MARYNLDTLAPLDNEIEKRGVVYLIPGEIESDSIMRAIQLKARLSAAEKYAATVGDDATPEEEERSEMGIANAIGDLRSWVEQLFRVRTPDFRLRSAEHPDGVDFTPTELLVIVSLAVSGGEARTPEEVLAEAITGKSKQQLEDELAAELAAAEEDGADPTSSSAAGAKKARSGRSTTRSPVASST